MTRKTVFETLFLLVAISAAVFASATAPVSSVGTPHPVSATKNASGRYDVSVFWKKSFSEKFAAVSPASTKGWQVLRVSDGSTDDYWLIGPPPVSDADWGETFPYYVGGGYDFRDSVTPDASVPAGTSVKTVAGNDGKPEFEYNEAVK